MTGNAADYGGDGFSAEADSVNNQLILNPSSSYLLRNSIVSVGPFQLSVATFEVRTTSI